MCIPDHHPGYVTWEQYLETQARLRANARPRDEGGGAAREGSALLQGLLRCGKCGRKSYSGIRGRTHTYLCSRTHQMQATRRPCQTIGGLRLDSTVIEAFLDAVNPAGVDATAAAVDHLEAEHAQRRRMQSSPLSGPSSKPNAVAVSSMRANRRTGSSPERWRLHGSRRSPRPSGREARWLSLSGSGRRR